MSQYQVAGTWFGNHHTPSPASCPGMVGDRAQSAFRTFASCLTAVRRARSTS